MKSSGSVRQRRSALVLALAMILGWFVGSPEATSAATRRLYVQKKFFQTVSGTSVSVTLHKQTVAGNLLIAYVAWGNTGAVSVADTRGNTWASAVGPTAAADGVSAQIFYAAGITGGPVSPFDVGTRPREAAAPPQPARSPPAPPASCSSPPG